MITSRVTLLGIPIDAVSKDEALAQIRQFLESGIQHHVTTPNNEMLVAASESKEFADVLRGSSLNLPDSTGLLFAARFTGQHLPERVTGIDTVESLCRDLGPEHPVFLLGAAPRVAEAAADVLKSRNPRLVVSGAYAGAPTDAQAAEIVALISAVQPHVLFVAFGAPAQDLWIAKHLRELPSVRVAMGVGGTFDFLAGIQIRAPEWMRTIGLEWLWRFVQEPRRAGRMRRALVSFPLLVFRQGKAASCGLRAAGDRSRSPGG